MLLLIVSLSQRTIYDRYEHDSTHRVINSEASIKGRGLHILITGQFIALQVLGRSKYRVQGCGLGLHVLPYIECTTIRARVANKH